MKKFLVFYWLFTIYSCSSKQNDRNEELNIVIEDDQSCKYDLVNRTYTVFLMRGDTTIHFTLADDEKKQITNQYYNLELDEILGEQTIRDNCDVMPKFHSVLKVKSKTRNQEITIDDSCGDYKGLFDTKGKRVSAFLRFVREMLHQKIEIKQAPESDIMYM